MERSEGIVRLFKAIRELGRTLGADLEESATGGGSDRNFRTALGAPTLDGLRAAGEAAHATT
jgi:glutamate carboxypeptidase